MEQDQQQRNDITASVYNSWWCRRNRISRTVYSGKHHQQAIQSQGCRSCKCTSKLRVARTIGVSERIDMSPSQVAGDGAGPATGVITLPHRSTTFGGVGATASAGQFTVEARQLAVQNQGCLWYKYMSIHESCQNNRL
jgi:hypothetical protein